MAIRTFTSFLYILISCFYIVKFEYLSRQLISVYELKPLYGFLAWGWWIKFLIEIFLRRLAYKIIPGWEKVEAFYFIK